VSTANKAKWPRRPPRLSRLFDNVRPFYFVTFNTYERRRLLARPEVHEAFCTFCSNAQKHGVGVGRYVIMPDHVHLFAAFPIAGIALPSWVQSLRTVMGKRLLCLEIHKVRLFRFGLTSPRCSRLALSRRPPAQFIRTATERRGYN